jgi:uncharacterized membrane protein
MIFLPYVSLIFPYLSCVVYDILQCSYHVFKVSSLLSYAASWLVSTELQIWELICDP